MWKLAPAVFFVAAIACAEVRSVCVEDRVSMNAFAWRAFQTEIRKLIATPELELTSGSCAGPAVSLLISAHPPARYANALGLARRNRERIFPELHLYQESVRKIIGEQASPEQLGRALARVAAHELGHYLLQQGHHQESGLMRASFGTTQLTAADSAPFKAKATH